MDSEHDLQPPSPNAILRTAPMAAMLLFIQLGCGGVTPIDPGGVGSTGQSAADPIETSGGFDTGVLDDGVDATGDLDIGYCWTKDDDSNDGNFYHVGSILIEECSAGCNRFMAPLNTSTGSSTIFPLQPGRYRVRLARRTDVASDIDGFEVEIRATSPDVFEALCEANGAAE